MTKQEREVQLGALVVERDSKRAALKNLSERAAKARERGDETEAIRVDALHQRQQANLKACERELAKLGVEAQTKQSRAAKRA